MNDSTILFNFNLGLKIKFIHIYIGANSELKNLQIFEARSISEVNFFFYDK